MRSLINFISRKLNLNNSFLVMYTFMRGDTRMFGMATITLNVVFPNEYVINLWKRVLGEDAGIAKDEIIITNFKRI